MDRKKKKGKSLDAEKHHSRACPILWSSVGEYVCLVWRCDERSAPALCDVLRCPLGATIRPSNSLQPGSGTHLQSLSLQRDGQLVRLGEVSFDVPCTAEASLFAHINGEEI